MTDWSFYRNKKVLITGHTGFKGSWMCQFLLELGATVIGYALEPSTEPSLFQICGLNGEIESRIGDIRNLEQLEEVFQETKPELVVHMAAQPLVRESYRKPVYTYDVNVMGTVNILECVRKNDCVKSFLNVTTDKVYLNREWDWGYRENEELNGYDPYSNSKSCSELVTSSFRNSYFNDEKYRVMPVSTARAGNVIGGGDFAADRIVPDCVRAAWSGRAIEIRNPYSLRPYQHVLEPIAAYLMILQEQYDNPALAGSYNVGPDESDCLYTGELVARFCELWERHTGMTINSTNIHENGPHEANYLKLDCSKIKRKFSWSPCWDVRTALDKTVEWYAQYASGEEAKHCTVRQIKDYLYRWQERGYK